MWNAKIPTVEGPVFVWYVDTTVDEMLEVLQESGARILLYTDEDMLGDFMQKVLAVPDLVRRTTVRSGAKELACMDQETVGIAIDAQVRAIFGNIEDYIEREEHARVPDTIDPAHGMGGKPYATLIR